jgi:PAS domain S-box-containing protein
MKSTIEGLDIEEPFRILGEEAPVGMCIMQDGKFCCFNSSFPIATGYTAAELIGKDSLEIVAREDRGMVKENTTKMLNGELLSPYQFRVIHKDGGTVWIMATVKSIQYHGRRAILGSYMEVTQRKQAEERIRESETRYRLLAENMEDVIWTVDITCPTRLTYISPSVARLLGYSAKESMTKEMEAVFTPASFDIAMKAFAEEMASEQKEQADRHSSRRLELQLRHKDGSLVDVEVNFSFMRAAYGQKGEILAVARDITQRKRMEEARREAEEEKSVFLEEAPVSIVHTNLKGEISYVNQRFESESGYSRGEIVGKSVFQLDSFPAGTLKFLAQRMDARLKGDPAKHWETQFKCKDERRIWIELEGKILRRSGVPVGFQIIATNITERKQAEEALRESEERYRKMFEEALDAIFIGDGETGIVLDCNRAACQLVGRERSGLIGRHQRILHPPETVEGEFSTSFHEHLHAKEGEIVETQVVTKEGEIKEVAIKANAFELRGKKVIQGIFRDVTERKQAEQALRQSEERYRTMLEEMEDAYSEVDLGGHFTFVNNSVCRDLGYSREELLGMSYKKLTAEDDIESVFRAFNEVYRTGMPNKGFSWKTIRKDGTNGFAETSISPIRNDKCEIIGFRSVGRDVTERKRQEQALADEVTRRRILVDQSRDGIVVLDPNGKVYEANQQFAEMLGYTPEEVREFYVWDWEYQSPREQVLEMLRTVDEAGDHFETRHRRKDGSVYDVEISTNGAMFAGQKLIFCVCRDISERKRAQEELWQSEENYRALFDSSVIGTIVLDAETGKAVMANQAAARIFGFGSPQEGIGRNPLDFVPPEDRETVREVIRQDLFEQDVRQTAQFRAVTKSGREIWLSVTAARIMHRGRLAGLISFADITEQKLQNERLMITDRLASIGELAAGAAHELNNPLASIIGLSELLMEKNTPDYIRKNLAVIRDEGRRAANVTSNLLTFARKHKPAKQITQINAIIEDVLKLRAYAHKSNSIKVERHLSPDLPEMLVDPFQMQQVFLNVVINAEYFMIQAHNKGTLTITTKRQNGGLQVSFVDDGPGIPREDLGRIFDPFFTTKEVGKGTGLGLSICHGIVAAHGGQIYARSQPSEGATIFIELPSNGRNDAEVML